jgi:hypothetical protein
VKCVGVGVAHPLLPHCKRTKAFNVFAVQRGGGWVSKQRWRLGASNNGNLILFVDDGTMVCATRGKSRDERTQRRSNQQHIDAGTMWCTHWRVSKCDEPQH